MASNFIDGIGVVSGALGIISFFQDLVPEDTSANGATIQVKAGNPGGDDDPGVGGDITAAYAWDRENRYLGESKGDSVKSGDTAELTIDSFSDGTQAGYVGISVGDDAVCVAWISVKQRDTTDGGSWTGDVGYECGQHWYEQIEVAGYLDKEETEQFVPKCTWLDADHTGDTPSASVKFDIDGYGENIEDTIDNDAQCDATLWGKDDAPINGQPDGGSKRRSLRPRAAWMEDVLVVSNITQHKAERLCSSDTSWGPDFIGPDGYFCDMDTHTLSPLCSAKNVDGCVKLDDEGNSVTKRSFLGRKRTAERSLKSYNKINHWD